MQQVVKINTALSNKPFFVKVQDSDLSIDRIFSEAVRSLRDNGKPLESKQLDALYEKHQMFNAGQTVSKGSLLNELQPQTQSLGDMEVQVYEIDLVTSHSGGSD